MWNKNRNAHLELARIGFNHDHDSDTILENGRCETSNNDEVRALILFSSLPECWNATVTVVSSSSGSNKLKFDDVRDLILSEEIRRKESEEFQPLQFCIQNQEEEVRIEDMDVEDPRKEGLILKIIVVSKTQRQLSVGIVESARKNHEDKAEANVASTSGGEDALICSLEKKEESWVLDSGASFHVTSQKEFFENYVPGNLGKVYLGKVYLGNEQSCEIAGKGVANWPMIGYTTVFHGDHWKISEGAMTIARGHMSEKGMRIMNSKGKLPSLQSTEFDMCEDCILGKQKRVSLQRSGRIPKKERLELVHSDVWGPTTVSSIGDDCSRKVWTYFLKNKFEVFKAFKIWKAMVENETGLKIKKLRSDNGGEYEDARFKKFCYEHGIRMERTVPGTPQHNGVAKRMNKTLTERAKSLRLQSGLPKQFWVEAVNTTTYLINQGSSVPFGNEIKLSHLKIFGYVAYVHIIDQGRNKLDPIEEGYRLWDNENQKMIRSRDVIFNEKVMYKDRNNTCNNNLQQSRPMYVEMDDVPETPRNHVIELPIPALVLRRFSRPHVPNRKYLNFILLTDEGEPENYEEACQMIDAIDIPVGKKALHNKWVYRVKEDHDGSKRYKARLVVKGFQQKEGVDYTEISAPVVKLNIIRSVLSIVANEGLYCEQLDVKTAFLHGDLHKDIYMHQPEGFLEERKKNMEGFQKCNADHYCFFKRYKSNYIILLFYVDDMLVAGLGMDEIKSLKQQLSKEFDMKDLGPAKRILGMQITRDKQKLGVVNRFMSNTGKAHWEAVKWILKYLRGTTEKCLYFSKGQLKVQGYVDADFGGTVDCPHTSPRDFLVCFVLTRTLSGKTSRKVAHPRISPG
ncbi:hypothetical protein V8G54_005689 [Vigna mungo]|uniref:Integrase catalytic domain-containing protein n=1 Tax=Vigna mungo TaxID=3915 RepID=A0AAQ3P0V5_VIGMU